MPINDIITSLKVVGQFPLDPKLTFKLLSDMQNLGTNDVNAFTYYESMLVVCNEDKKQYIWRSPIVVNETGVLATSYTYPANTISDGIDYSNRVFNFFEYTVSSNNVPIDQADIIYDGTVYWLQNLDYRSTPITYRISNNDYTAPITNLTLAPAHSTLNRRDIFVVNTSNQIVIITGTPAVNPQEPVVSIGSQLKVSSVYIPATATQPQGVANALVYNENLGTPTEWAATYDGSIPATVVLASVTDPSDGTVSIETTDVDVINILRFDAAALVTVQGLSSIQFKIKHKTTQNYILDIVLKRSAVVVSSLSLNMGDYVFDPTDNSAYQVINIPASVLNLTVADIDFIGFNVNGGSGTISGFFLDSIQLMYGSENPTVEGTYLGLNDTFDTNFIGKKGFTPIINDTETGLDLKRAVKLTDIYSNNQLINYSYVWTTGLTFEVTVVEYIMNGILLPTNGTIFKTVVLAVADGTNPRKDIIVVNEDETVSVLQGTPSATPAEPVVDYNTQIPITVIDIPANSLTPEGVSDELIYDENVGEPNEWTVTENTGGARFDLANTGDPFSGTKAIKGTLVQGGDKLTFTNNAVVPVDGLNSLNFRLKNSFNTNLALVVTIKKGGITISLPLLKLTDGFYGYDEQNYSTYQNIVIPASVFAFTDIQFDSIDIGFKVVGGGTINIVYIDKVRLVYGGEAIITDDIIRNSRTYYIDSTGGDDTTGIIGRKDKPYQNIDTVLPLLPIQTTGTATTNVDTYIELIKAGNYVINSVIPHSNIIFQSKYKAHIDFSANTNVALFTIVSNGPSYKFYIPHGNLTFNTGINQYFQRLWDVEIICNVLTGSGAGTPLFNDCSSVRVKCVKTILLKQLAKIFNQTVGNNPYSSYEAVETVVNAVDISIIVMNTSSAKAIIRLGDVTGTGNILLVGINGEVYVNNITTTGNTILAINNADATIFFNNSVISGTTIKTTTWVLGSPLVLSGRIDPSSPGIDTGSMASGNLILKDFWHDLKTGSLLVYRANLTMINSTLLCDTIPFNSNKALTISLYGNNNVYSRTPTNLGVAVATETMTINDYGRMATNILNLGSDVVLNKLYNNKVSQFDNDVPYLTQGSVPETVFINSTTGNNGTALLGDPTKPYLTLDAALVAQVGTGEQSNKFMRFVIMDNATYEITSQLAGLINMEIASDYACTVSLDNNTNTTFWYTANAGVFYSFYFNMPNGRITQQRTGGTGCAIQLEDLRLSINVRSVITDCSSNLFQALTTINVEKLIFLTVAGGGNIFNRVDGDLSITTLTVNGTVYDPLSAGGVFGFIKIRNIAGTGGYSFQNGNFKIGDISTTLQCKLHYVTGVLNIHFDNSIISTATGFRLGNQTIGTTTFSGNIISSPLLDTINITSGTLRFVNFVADFKAGFIALGSAGKLIIENSSLKFDVKLANILTLTSADAITIKNSTIEQVTPGDLTTGGDGTHTIITKGVHTNALRLSDNTNVIIDKWNSPTIKSIKTTLNAAQINAIGTTNITVIAAPGAGKAIRIIQVLGRLNYGTTAFDNNILQLEPIGGTGNHQFYVGNLIDGVADVMRSGQEYNVDDNIRENEAMVIDGTDSVAVGDGTVDLYITYEIITL